MSRQDVLARETRIDAGGVFSVAELLGPTGRFVALAALRLWVLISTLQQIFPTECGIMPRSTIRL